MLARAISQMIKIFSKPVLQEGQAFSSEGKVLTIRLSDGLLKARVMGKTQQIYNVFLDFKTWPTQLAQCSCQKKTNCEHVAACLFSLEVREKLDLIPAFEDRYRVKPLDSPSVFSFVPENIIDADEVTWYSDCDPDGSSHDFFSYQLGIVVDGKSISLVAWVISFIEQFGLSDLDHWPDDKLIRIPIGDARALEVPFLRVKPFIQLLVHMGIPQVSKDLHVLYLTRYQLLFMQEAEQAIKATAARWRGTEQLRHMLQHLISQECLTHIAAPKSLHATLREYQYQGFNWLQRLRMSRFGGVLADDMGRGKTIQTLALLQYEKEANRLQQACLIIAPTSVIGNWLDECRRFTPNLKVLVYHGQDRSQYQFDQYDVIISTYGLVQRDKNRFIDYCFYYIILDEAQFIKNTQTKTRQIIQQLQAQHRLCLTGTPLENHLGELWSLFHFLTPGLLGDRKQFRQFFRNPIEKYQDKERQQLLIRRIQPFLLRRTKNQVACELPKKTEITRAIQLTGKQRDLYEAIRMSTEREVRQAIAKQGLGKSHLILLDALLKLRQVCCDPRLLTLPDAAMAYDSSAKLEACMELLDNLMDEGRSVLVFSQFTSMLALIEEELVARPYAYLKLTGKTQDRQTLVRRFQAGEVPIFLVSLKAGGTGLNLTQADTVIHYDPWWNPAVEDQATDRIHRIGQQKPVFVYRLITTGTVEEAMMTMQARKRQLFKSILSDELMGTAEALTESDINHLFAPLE